MTPRLFHLAPLFLHATLACAQFNLGLSVKPLVAVQYEPIRAELVLQNNTGEILDFTSNGNCRVSYEVMNDAGERLAPVPGIDQAEPFLLAPAATTVLTNMINADHDLSASGSYKVRARVAWRDQGYLSQDALVEVTPGVEMAALTAANPQGGKRKYGLRLVNRDRYEVLFLRIDDPQTDTCVGVTELGPIIRVTPPAMRVDAAGQLHVLIQKAPIQHAYFVFSPDGEWLDGDVIGGSMKKVQLEHDADGRVELKVTDLAPEDLQPGAGNMSLKDYKRQAE